MSRFTTSVRKKGLPSVSSNMRSRMVTPGADPVVPAIESLVAGALSDVLSWIPERLDVSISEFENIVREAITNEFKSENQERLVQAFQVDFEKDALTYDAFGDA